MTAPAASRALKALLFFQLGVGAILVAGDLGGAWQGLPFARPDAPGMDAPVRPGDQRRRYETAPSEQREGFPATDLPERLTFIEDGNVLNITGAIAPGDSDRFADWLANTRTLPEAARLTSPGGSVSDALAIGRALRDAGLNTIVDSICFSACPYVFAAGADRSAGPNARIGVHQHYFGESTILPAFLAVEDVQRGQADVMNYLDDMGVDVRVMGLALSTPPDEIYILLPEELAEYRLVTDG